MNKLFYFILFTTILIFPSLTYADGPYLNIPPTNAFDKIHSNNGTITAANFSMPLNIKGGTNISVQSNNSTHTVTIINTMTQNQGTYNKTLANNVVINSGGSRINFINGTNSTTHLVNDPTRNQINVTISSTGGGGGGSGVSSLNALTGALTIACVTGNTTCTTSGGNTITVNTAYNVVVTNGARQIITKPLNMTQDLTMTAGRKIIFDYNNNDYLVDTGGGDLQTKIKGNTTLDVSINQVQLLSNAAGATPTLLIRNLGSIPAGSTAGQILFYSPNSVGTAIQFGNMITAAQTLTAGSEDSAYRFFTYHKGTQTEFLRVDGAANATRFLNGAVVVGTGGVHSTTSGDNFFYLPVSNGAVTANPAAFAGSGAEYYDNTNNRNCFYNGAWKCFAFLPQNNFTTPANQTGTASLTGVLLGDGVTLTPATTGAVEITVTGYGTQNTGADGGSVQIERITGGCQANGAPIASGTAFGSNEKMTMSATTTKVPFSLTIQNTGLTLGQKYCYEIKQVALTGGTFTVLNVVWSAKEL